ncbi:phage tail protein [Enterococcus faecalis]|uniref:phage tail tube protein n=1 Tax=Enterococcus faecalis TaxID=1351 RepID=UPI00177C0BE7|nr:phage tail tube protein [Enterococcus faecalis]MBD9846474.1 phage tail protein [Enterococcus faecalis]
MSGLLSKGTKLEMKAAGGTFKELAGLQSVPEIGGDPEQVDVTTLADSTKKYIAGIQDMDSLEFTFLYDQSVFKELKVVQNSGKEADFKITYPDNTTCTFTGGVTVKMGGAEVNGAFQMTLAVTVSSGPDFDDTPKSK